MFSICLNKQINYKTLFGYFNLNVTWQLWYIKRSLCLTWSCVYLSSSLLSLPFPISYTRLVSSISSLPHQWQLLQVSFALLTFTCCLISFPAALPSAPGFPPKQFCSEKSRKHATGIISLHNERFGGGGGVSDLKASASTICNLVCTWLDTQTCNCWHGSAVSGLHRCQRGCSSCGARFRCRPLYIHIQYFYVHLYILQLWFTEVSRRLLTFAGFMETPGGGRRYFDCLIISQQCV